MNPIRFVLGRMKYHLLDRRHKSLDKTLEYWETTEDVQNGAKYYIEEDSPRTDFLVNEIKKIAKKDASIIELGCNVGRNLEFLRKAGYNNLFGIEISPKAVELLKTTYPELDKIAMIEEGSLESWLPLIKDDSKDVVFTMATLEHIHKRSIWIFPHIVRITNRYLITMEDEENKSWRHFPRNYKKIFGDLGMKQIKEIDGSKIPQIETSRYKFRVFEKVRE